MEPVRLALLNMEIEAGEPGANAEALLDYARRAAAEGAEYVFAPELTLTGYAVRRFRELAEPPDGPLCSRLVNAAAELGVVLGFGAVLAVGDDIFNAYVVAGRHGAALFGKFHRWWLGDSDFTPWPRPSVLPLRDFTLGVMVCFDGRFPETARTLALMGADLIVWPSCWPAPPKSDPRFLDIIGRARSFENQCYVALANRCGSSAAENTEYAGASALFGPTGEVVERAAGEPGIVMADMDLDRLRSVRRSFDIYSERRPELYRPLCELKRPPWAEEAGR